MPTPQPTCPIRVGEPCTLCYPGADGPHNCGLVYLVMSDPELRVEWGERRRAQQALNQAKGRLRSLVGTKAGLRLTPQLEFIFDEVPGEAHEIEDILALAHKRDEELAKSRANAQYAGDADPYKHDEPDDDDFDDDDDVEVEDWDDDDEACWEPFCFAISEGDSLKLGEAWIDGFAQGLDLWPEGWEEGLDEEVLSGAVDAIRHADTLIIGGTSLVVYPAAGLIRYFRGDNLVVINMQPTGADASADLCIAKPIGQVLSEDISLD